MAIRLVGINHKTASVDVRERVSFTPDVLEHALANVCALAGVSEAVIISTCNRTELCISGQLPDEHVILDWLASYHHVDASDLQACTYCFDDEKAVRHVMRVASGLDSLVLGEPQILGQLKSAFADAQKYHAVGADLGRLFRQTFTIAKRVRTQTAIGENPVSVAFAAVRMSQRIFADVSKTRVLLIGAGETIQLVARHLVQAGVKDLVVANRTLSRAQTLVDEFHAKAVLIEDVPFELERADMVISSTASPLPIVGKGTVEHTMKLRRYNPMFMVDLAVPRDIEPSVADLANVYLYPVDDLRDIVDEGVRSREQAASQAEVLVNEGVSHYLHELKALNAVNSVTQLRRHIEGIFADNLEKSLKQLEHGGDPDQIMKQFSHVVSQKILHEPTLMLRKAGKSERHDVFDVVSELFQLESTRKSD